MTPIVLRAGVIYGRGLKLIEGARWLLRRRLLAVWREPTWTHLLSLPDFLRAVEAALEMPGVGGVYNVADDGPLTAQELLDRLADHWGYPRPRRLPKWTFPVAAACCEAFATVFRTPCPLHRDLIRAGMTSTVADTSRMKRELLSELAYPNLQSGLSLL